MASPTSDSFATLLSTLLSSTVNKVVEHCVCQAPFKDGYLTVIAYCRKHVSYCPGAMSVDDRVQPGPTLTCSRLPFTDPKASCSKHGSATCRRRLVKKLYIPLPDAAARRVLITAMLQGQQSRLRGKDIEQVVLQTDGYSGADLRALCQEAAMVPIR